MNMDGYTNGQCREILGAIETARALGFRDGEIKGREHLSADSLLDEIRKTISLLPSVTGTSPVRDNDGIIMAIRDLQECYVDASHARNGMYTKMQARAEAAEAKVEAAEKLAQAAEELLTRLDEMGIGMKAPRKQKLREALAAYRKTTGE